MNKYVLFFSKRGYSKYTSHLDMLRLFKRAFRRADIALSYSHGFNPHPQMSFAQPLSLGYSACREMLEFSTDQAYDTEDILRRLRGNLAEGMDVSAVLPVHEKKALAGQVDRADYEIIIPVPYYERDYSAPIGEFLAQDQILAMKRQKKSKELKEVDIREKIVSMEAVPSEGKEGVGILKRNLLQLNVQLDCGSQSNLSPELLLSAFLAFSNLPVERHRIEVCRTCMHFPEDSELEKQFGGMQE